MTIQHYENLLVERDDVLFLHGACHVFALALRERFSYSLRMVRDTTAMLPNGATHVFCHFDASRGVDVLGLFNVAQRLRDEGWLPLRYEIVAVTDSDLAAYYTGVPGGGLYLEPSFVAKVKGRAVALIDQFGDHYCGQNPHPVPGLHRLHQGDWRAIFDWASAVRPTILEADDTSEFVPTF